VSWPVAAADPASPADALTSALVAMGQAQVGPEVLKAWLGQQGEIPRLTGEQLARLKTAGLTDDLLLHLVRGGFPAPEPLPEPAVETAVLEPEPPPPPPERASAQGQAAGEGARIRVMVQSVPAVDYCELALDGEVIATLGRLFEGMIPAGSHAPRGRMLHLRKPALLFEGEVAPGRHLVQTGFVISRLQEEFGDLRSGGRRQRVRVEGVRALATGQDGEQGGEEEGTVCTVGPGEVCHVTARFRRSDPGLPGGRVDYDVSYDTLVLTERTRPEIQTAGWAVAPAGVGR
jgi:hypothetical protein